MASTLFNLTEATSLPTSAALYLVVSPDTAGNDRYFTVATLNEHTQDLMATTLVGGSNISVSYNDGAGTITIAYTGAPPPASTTDLPEGTNLYFTDERAQDAVGAMVGASLVYVDGTPLLARAALTGDVTAAQNSNATTISSSAVTNDKLADMAQATIKGRAAGAGTGAPVDLTAAQVRALASARELLTAARSYYVATTGNDSNDGLTIGAPFLTIQKAVDVVASIDLSTFDATINVAAGTYAETVTFRTLVGAGRCVISGAGVGSTIVAPAAGRCFLNTAGYYGIYDLRNMSLSPASGFDSLLISGGGNVKFRSLDFGASGAATQITCGALCLIEAEGAYSISGGGFSHVASYAGAQIRVQGRAITLTGTPAFSGAFAVASRGGVILLNGNSYTGGATGPYVNVTLGGGLVVLAAESTLPGNAAGTVTSPGWYT